MESISVIAVSSASLPINSQVRILSSHHHSMLLVWRATYLSERRHHPQRVMLWEREQILIPFHWMWKTCGLVVLIHQELQNSHSIHFSHWDHWLLVMAYSGKWPHLNCPIFLLFNPLKSELGVSVLLNHSHWLVWLVDWFEFTDLPQLQSVKLGEFAFEYVHSVVFESDWMSGLMIQIYRNCSQSNLVNLHSWCVIRLCLRVIEWMDWWFRFA